MKKRKKILYIITKSVWGGAQKYVFDLATGLPKDEFEVFVASGGREFLAEKIRRAEIPYFEIKNFQRDINFFKDIFAFFELLKLIKKIRPDIIHTSSSKAGGLAGLAAKLYSLLITHYSLLTIFTAHGWGFNEPRSRRQIALIKILSKITAKFYRKIICVSEYDKQAALKNKITKPEKLITIHNGVSEIDFLGKNEAKNFLAQKTDANLKLSDILIGTIGEFTKNKGQRYLIEAIAKIIKNHLGVKFILMGWGEDKENLKFKISAQDGSASGGKNLKLDNNVFLIENLNPAGPYLKAFDIFVLPSLKEGLPYTLLEAGLAKLPIVATKVGGVPEIIENEKTGLLVEPAHPEELGKAIEKLISEPEFSQNLASNLQQKILLEFSLEKMIKETVNLYKNF
ncbi:MAG: Second mannosyl transferase [Parcubacteria group bacterium GW2011_GWB1_41_6]|nr:MAG: Second mannosyl transferase [Parcubacteria group bacterium GW2011_GWB1_41_6]